MALEFPQSISDQNYLKTKQYNNAEKLGARMQLHQRFSTNTYGWHRWVFDHFHLPSNAHILEAGCGPGTLWLKNKDRISEGWDITLSDFSQGMLQEAQQNLADVKHPFTFTQCDIQSLPFEEASFDGIIANHMLYHVPDRAKAFAEIRRVLKSDGRFYAATNGRNHMSGIRGLANKFDPQIATLWGEPLPLPFRIETGTAELIPWFSTITLYQYDSNLVIPEAEPIVAFVLSTPVGAAAIVNRVEQFREFVEQEITEHGAIRLVQSTGLFEAW